MYLASSKPLTSDAKVVGKLWASKRVIGPTAVRPSTWLAKRSPTVWPSGVMTPIPVMTTLRRMRSAFPLLHDDRRTLPQIGVGRLHRVWLRDRPGRAGVHRDGA